MLSKQIPLGIYEKALPAECWLGLTATGKNVRLRFCRDVGR